MSYFRHHKKKIALASIGLIILVTLAAYFLKSKPAENYYKVKRENFESIIACKGEIQSEKSTLITIPEIFGDVTLELYESRIKDLIPEGSIVKQGDYVALLDQGTIKQYKEANEEILKKEAFELTDSKIDSAVDLVALRQDLEQFTFDVKVKKIELEQSVYESPAYQRKAAMAYERTSMLYDEKYRAYLILQKSLRIRIQRDEEVIRKLRLKDKNYGIAFEQARIKAPKDGMLIYGRTFGRSGPRKITIEAMVSMHSPTIATLPELSVLNSETYVEEIYISKIKIGDSARVFVDALKNEQRIGVISSISNVGQEMVGFDSKVFKVNIRIASEKNKIKPAMTTNNEIIIAKESNVLVIPRTALILENGKSFVITKGFGENRKKEVIAGTKSDKQVVIKSGLMDGELILLNRPEL
ncbi:MAG: hypothetical protein NTV75_02020 [Bacteroidia bacterium]|nr:hypothetical protein [Bacteroidia bacterium]